MLVCISNSDDSLAEPITDFELAKIGDVVPPECQDRLAIMLGEDATKVAILRSANREDVAGVTRDLLRSWKEKNPHQGNRMVSKEILDYL